jgi:plasmid maintenance system antidote protein VapI
MEDETLILALQVLQGDRTQAAFAADLGIGAPALSRLYSGEIRLGRELAARIVARYPEIRDVVADALLGSVSA